jgi:omega-amidase
MLFRPLLFISLLSSSSSLKLSTSLSPLASSVLSTTARNMSALAYVPKKAASLQFHITSNTTTNTATAKSLIYDTCAKQGSSLKLIVLPEVWNSPYATAAFPKYGKALPNVGDNISESDDSNCEEVKMLSKAAKDNGVYIVGGTMPERSTADKIYNTCLCFDPEGKVVARHRKVHLFDIDVPGGIRFMESDTLTKGEQLLTFFDTGDENFGKVGVGICYDIRFPEISMLLRSKHDVSLICYPGAFNMVTGPAHWELLQRARAVDSQSFVITASPVSNSQPPNQNQNQIICQTLTLSLLITRSLA